MEATGATTAIVNGTYVFGGINDGVPYYEKSGIYLYRYGGSSWILSTILNSVSMKELYYFVKLFDPTDSPDGLTLSHLGELGSGKGPTIHVAGTTGSITPMVYCDANSNGKKEKDEEVIPGVRIELYPPAGKMAEKWTVANGTARFWDLEAGDYQFVVDNNTLPAGAVSTTGGDSSDVSLAAGQNYFYVYFGYTGFDCSEAQNNWDVQRLKYGFPIIRSSKTWPEEGWDNLIDGDVEGWDGTVTAFTTEGEVPYAVLALDEYMQTVQFNEVEIVTDMGREDDRWTKRKATKVEILISTTGTEDTDFTSVATLKLGSDIITFQQNIGNQSAKYVMIKILTPTAWAKFAQIVELRLFNSGEPVSIGQSSHSYNLVALPETTQLMNAYPNPFNPQTTIEFNLTDATNVSIRVFDLQGREVDSLVDGYKSAGFHNIVWDAHRFASGTYFVVMQAGHIKQTKKVILLK